MTESKLDVVTADAMLNKMVELKYAGIPSIQHLILAMTDFRNDIARGVCSICEITGKDFPKPETDEEVTEKELTESELEFEFTCMAAQAASDAEMMIE